MGENLNQKSLDWLNEKNISFLVDTLNNPHTTSEEIVLKIQPTGEFGLYRENTSHRPVYDIPTKQMLCGLIMNYCHLFFAKDFDELERDDNSTYKDIKSYLGVKKLTSNFIPWIYNHINIVEIHVPQLHKQINFKKVILRRDGDKNSDKDVTLINPGIRFFETATCETPYFIRMRVSKSLAEIIRMNEHEMNDVTFGDSKSYCSMTIATEKEIQGVDFIEYNDIYTDEKYVSTFTNAIKNYNQLNIWDRYGLALMLMYYCDSKGIAEWDDVTEDILNHEIDGSLIKMVYEKYIQPYLCMEAHFDEINQRYTYTWNDSVNLSDKNTVLSPFLINMNFKNSRVNVTTITKEFFNKPIFKKFLNGEECVFNTSDCVIQQRMSPFFTKGRMFGITDGGRQNKDNTFFFALMTALSKDKLYKNYCFGEGKNAKFSGVAYMPNIRNFSELFKFVRYVFEYSQSAYDLSNFSIEEKPSSKTKQSTSDNVEEVEKDKNLHASLLRKTNKRYNRLTTNIEDGIFNFDGFQKIHDSYADNVVGFYNMKKTLEKIDKRLNSVNIDCWYEVGPDIFKLIGDVNEDIKQLMDNDILYCLLSAAKRMKIDGKWLMYTKRESVEAKLVNILFNCDIKSIGDFIELLRTYQTRCVKIECFDKIIKFIMCKYNISQDMICLAQKLASDIKGASYRASLKTFFNVNHTSEISSVANSEYETNMSKVNYRHNNHINKMTMIIDNEQNDTAIKLMNSLLEFVGRITGGAFRFRDDIVTDCLTKLSNDDDFVNFKQLVKLYINTTQYKSNASKDTNVVTEEADADTEYSIE